MHYPCTADIRTSNPWIIRSSEKGVLYSRSLQPYFVQLPLTTFLLFQKIHLPQKVANRVFTQSLHFAYSATFIPVQNLLIPAPFRSFVHTLFAYTRKLARGHSASGTGRNASTVSPVAACICFAVALRFVGCLFPQAGIFIRVHFFAIRKHRILKIQLLLAVSVRTLFV